MTQEQAFETLRLLRKDRETILSLAREHSDRCPPWEKLGMLQLIDAIQDLPLPKAAAFNRLTWAGIDDPEAD